MGNFDRNLVLTTPLSMINTQINHIEDRGSNNRSKLLSNDHYVSRDCLKGYCESVSWEFGRREVDSVMIVSNNLTFLNLDQSTEGPRNVSIGNIDFFILHFCERRLW